MPENTTQVLEVPNYLDTEPYRQSSNEPQGLTTTNLKQSLLDWLFFKGYVNIAEKIAKCGQLFIPFSDSQGYRMYKRTFCRNPLCPICAETGSAYNLKRAKSIKDDMLGRCNLGHLVLTLPKEISQEMPARDKIEKLYKLTIKVLKEVFDAEAGAIALHLTGDKYPDLHLHFDSVFFCFIEPVSVNLEGLS